MYQSAREIENRVAARMSQFRQAERDVAQFGMAFDADSAEELYRGALEHTGIPKGETAGLNISALRMLLRSRPQPGSPAWRNAPPLAYDSTSGEKSVLDDILA